MTKTYIAQAKDIDRKCFVVDAKDKVLGRLASKVAAILRGKHKAIYTPHVDTGDMVVIINAEKIRVTGNKMSQKKYLRYTGYPSGQRSVTLEEMMKKRPTQALRLAITRMMPKGRLGGKMIQKLKIYAGDKQPHQAQKPTLLEV
ncbi:MAG: 50S ribosomal protein L13 [Candidatus Omnitrophota bacterium]